MANVLAELFQNTAIAIREKTGEEGTMKPAEFPEKIRGITVTEEADLEELTVTENGVYSNAIIYGNTYTFKDELTTEELKAIDKMAAGEDFEVKKLYTSADGTVILDTYVDIDDGHAILGFTSGSDRFNYYDERAAAFWQQSKGWTKLDGNNVVSVEPPTMVFEENGTLYVPSIEDLSVLFPLADGYSKITVNVPSAEQKLVTLTVTENGTYYPKESIENGKTYTLRSDFTQDELRSFYEASLTKSEDGMFAFLCEFSDEMLGIMYAYDYYGVYISDGHLWLPEEFASAMGFASGWNFGTDLTDLTPAQVPSVSFETYELMISGGLSALNPLFDLPAADGFSSVEVNVAGSGAVAGAHTLTFLNYDQSLLYEKQTIDGDDSYDPVIKGKITKPTRESTAQYHYTYSGWSAVENGAANSNVLKSIREDKTLYTAFTSEIRSYTVRFYDSNGTTILAVKTYNYGEIPSHDPEKSGYSFVGWTPEITAVTGDMNYTAVWQDKITFAKGTWADIARISESGEARNYFKIGDKRTISYNGYDMEIFIAGFDHDDLANGNGKAGMTIISRNVTDFMGSNYVDGSYAYLDGATHRSMLNPLPMDLQAVLKTVTKEFSPITGSTSGILEPDYRDVKIFSPSFEEMNYDDGYTDENKTPLGTSYEYFINNPLNVQQVFPCNTNTYCSEPVWVRGIIRGGASKLQFMRSPNGYKDPIAGWFTPNITQLYYDCHYKLAFCI